MNGQWGTERAECRFYAELNDFLPRRHRFVTVVRLFEGEVSVKDLIEAAGVPHTEVDLVIVNSESVDFTYRVRDGDRIAVYPAFEALDIGPIASVQAGAAARATVLCGCTSRSARSPPAPARFRHRVRTRL